MNRKSIVLFAMAAAAFGQANSPSGLKVWFGDGTGLEIHTESTGANLPVSTSGSETVPAGYDFHRLIFDKQGGLLLGYDIEARKAGQGTFTVRIKPVDTDKFKVGGLGKWLDIPTLTGVREFPPLRMGDAVQVDILYHPGTGERIYDVLKVLGDRPPAQRRAGTRRRAVFAGKHPGDYQWQDHRGRAQCLDAGSGVDDLLAGPRRVLSGPLALSGLPPSGIRMDRPQHFKILRRWRTGRDYRQEQYASEFGLQHGLGVPRAGVGGGPRERPGCRIQLRRQGGIADPDAPEETRIGSVDRRKRLSHKSATWDRRFRLSNPASAPGDRIAGVTART